MHALTRHTLIDARHISFSYGEGEVLHDISLSVCAGDYVGIVGPNGAGKSTFLRVMLGLLTPLQGNIALFNEPIQEFREWWRIGYVPQKVTNFDINFPVTVEEVALMGRYAKRGMFKKVTIEDRRQVEAALTKIGMWEYRNRLIGDLSGGQQQRVFIARALAGQPEIIFLDEPTTGIDEVTRNEFYALLKHLNTEFGLTLVLVSHDLEKVAEEASHIVVIDRTVMWAGSPQEFAQEGHRIHHLAYHGPEPHHS
ncbi:MAG: metal ABC transporter ATP-binding protein [Patescibacteria group bacterium]|nr:metal ABC transporter ATP-binding protein [Patescibacteria group bacterium]MDE2438341.1 metal ABC transporter ATP-binding protein [Patescibacteria group bacterium]